MMLIIWESIKYDVNRASKDFENLEVKAKSIEPIKAGDEFDSLRNELLTARDEIFDKYGFDFVNKLEYQFDLLYGIELYEILNKQKGFTNRVATSDDVWRYLSICVIPDVVHPRWGLNEARYFKEPRRIWLKTIWWYVHLSWQGSKEQTYETLRNNTTDTIVQLVERPNLGYYVDLYRELMSQYSKVNDSSRNIFRKAMKLNTARLMTVSPELVTGGIKQYVTDLLNDAKEQG